MDFRGVKVLNRYFEEQAEKTPDRIAVFSAEKSSGVTYRELNERANRLAHLLRGMGVKPDSIVALMVDPSIECILGIMAILKAGGAYLPIDPHLPKKRIKFMLADSGVKVLLTAGDLDEKEIIINCQLLIVNCKLKSPPQAPLHHSSFIIHHSNHLSYIIYTSGSTGAPKGVAVEHRNVVNLVLGLHERVYRKYGEGLRVALAAPCIFDGSVKQVFGALLLGHTLCIVPGDTRVDGVRLAEFYNKYRIDISDGAPAHIRLLTGVTPAPGVKHFLIGGEALSVSVVERFYSGYGNGAAPLITNVYGPTECCVDTTSYEVSRESIHKLRGFSVVPIGTPLLNQEVIIAGEPGELCIAGANVSRGYLNNPELTAERFNRSYRSHKTYIFYKTGDLARRLSNGNIEFLGRIDHQVKVRGFRIELGEIEARLATHPAVKEAAVTDREDNFGEKYLCAYVVLAAAAASISAELKEYLSLTLPEYMVPLFFVILDKMPLTASGKVDRRSLPAPIPTARASYASPDSVMEKTLVEIWSGVLGIDAGVMGVADHFLEWGGHSLKAAAIIARVYDKFHFRLSLADVFKYPRIREMAQYLQRSPGSKPQSIGPAGEKPFYRLSSAQKRIYIAGRMAPDSTLYNIPLVFQAAETAAPLDKERLESAFKQLIARHESFRTSFHPVDDQPMQTIHKEVTFKVEEEKGFHHSSFIIHHFVQPFDLSRAPLLRAGLFKTGKGRRLLLVDMHHIISDGLSVEIFRRELEALYAGEVLPPLPLRYRDYAEWEYGEQRRVRLKEQEQYWLKEFNEDIPPLYLPLDYPRPPVPTYKGDVEEFRLGGVETAAWDQLAREYHMTHFMLALAVYAIFLAKISGQEIIVVGTPNDGRGNPELQPIIGMFVNTAAVRSHPAGGKPLRVFLEETRDTVMSVFENRDYPFEQLVEKLALERDPSRHPLFDVILAFREKTEMEKIGDRQEMVGALKLERLKYHEKTAKYDLGLSAAENDGKLDFILDYSTELFKAETIRCFVSYFKKITGEVLHKNGSTLLWEIDPLPGEERRRLLYQFNDTARDYPGDKTIQRLFAEQAEKTPDYIVLVGADPRVCPVSLSYRQLNEQSDSLACLLIGKGVLADDIVGIMFEPSVEMIIGLLGILKSGGAYLPIDPEYPQERIDYMLKDSGVMVLLGMEKFQKKIIINCQLLIVNCKFSMCDLEKSFHHASFIIHHSSNLAYVIYTSGTTGRAKGVAVEHRGVVNMLLCRKEEYRLDTKAVALQLFSFAFDGFVTGFFTPVVSGARVILLPGEELKEITGITGAIVKYGVTHFICVPALYRAILESAGREELKGLEIVTLAGDVVLPDIVEHSGLKNEKIEIVVEYGVTEASVMSTVGRRQESREWVTIGKPIWNTGIYILDRYSRLQPTGAAGELYIGGDGLARGYLNNPGLTAEKFIKNRSYRTYKTYIFYKTCDLARWLSNGNIQFLGRVDQQVKIRGFRIELGEIENRLASHPSVKEAVVTAREDKPGEKRLCAYITPREAGTFDVHRLKEHLAQYLPLYMVPQYYVEMERLPLTPNGKVDSRALPEPRVETGGIYAPPRDPAEEALVKIWRDILFDKDAQTPPLGIDDNFFEIGGHSLKATILTGRIERIFHIKCPLTHIFQRPTIREQARLIRETAEPWDEQIPPVEEKEYYPLSSAQKRLFFLDRWESIGVSYNMTFAFNVKGKLDNDRLKRVSLLLIERHESLRTSFHLLGDEPVQRINKSKVFGPTFFQKGGPPEAIIKFFDLSCAPLLRVGTIAVSAEEMLLVFDMHHIIGDGISMGVFFEEFSRLYNSGDPASEAERLLLPDVRYRDFVQWQNRLLESGKLKEQEEYWLGLYPDVDDIPRLELPADFPRPVRLSFGGDHYRFSLTPEETRRFRQSIRTGGVTPYMGLLAAFIVLLYKYSGQNDMVIGTGVMGRRHATLENIIGMFVNTVAIRHFPHGDMTYEEFLRQVKDNNIKAFENQDVQFEALVERLNLPRDAFHNPLFDVLFVLQNFQPGELLLESAVLTPYPLEKKNSKFDLTLFAGDKGEQITFVLEYSTALFKKETMERMAGHFARVLRMVCETPAVSLDAAELLSAEEKRQLVEDFNRTAAEYPAEKTIHQLFEEQVDKTPDRIALFVGPVGLFGHVGPVCLTYRQLHEQANRLANYLYREIAATPGECVAILLDRSIDRVMAMLGVLAAGGAYIPLESSLPEERIKTVIDDASVGMVISQKKYIRLLNRLQWDCNSFRTFLCLDSEDIYAEEEIEQSQLMDTKLWEYVGETARDEITGGGWISSYTGEPIPAAEMAEYGDNVLRKLEPLLHKKMRVLEIGCATGITMFRIAPRVGFYYGTDLSPVIIEKNKQRVIAEGHQNIRLACMAAHEIDGLEEENFDLAIINSVIQCFHGHNYLRRVLRKVVAKTGSPGYLFIGDIMDQGLKESLVRELKEFKRKSGERTKTDWSAELFVARDFFEDLQGDIPEIGEIEFSRKIYTIENELTKFRYDALLTIGKRRRGVHARHKYQEDVRALEKYGKDAPTAASGSGSPAYVIYTSGTTGKPRGVMVEHRSLVNLCWWHHRYYEVTEWDRAVQFAGFSFDASVWEVFPYLVKGAASIVIPNEMGPDVGELNEFFEKHDVTIAFLPTPLCEQFMAIDNRSLRVLLTGGDKLRHYIKRNYRLYNNYGPTENTVVATAYKVDDFSANIPIGAPISNNQIYILNKKNLQLQPVGVPGELCIAGDSLARGYLNQPEITGEKFKIINYKLQIINGSGALRAENFHHSSFIIHHSILYRTGDLARWLSDGNIEFLGRMDQQVKIRGFRIELEEIRGRLEKHEEVKEAAVVVREDADGEKKLCAYIVSRHAGGAGAGVEIIAKLGDFLAITLPEYMIPAHFVLLEKIPLTVSGKIDRKALPAPASWGQVPDGGNIPPRDALEKTLARIWTEVLNPGGDKSAVGIDTDFFKAGGHSLKVAALVSRIHRELNVRLPLSQVFAGPTIRGLAEYIRGAVGEQWSGIAPAPVRNDYPLSPAQRRIYIMDRLGAMYNMPRVMTATGNLDLQKLESALIKMIRRHESLRTSFHMMEDQPAQRIHDNVETKVFAELFSKSDPPEAPLKEFIRPFDLSQAPLLRVGVMKEAEEQYVLMMDTHHIVSDGISQGIFMKELWALYAGQVLPPPRVQYKDYAWQQHQQRENKENAWRDMETFWVHRFQGEIPPLELPYDFPRPPAQDYRGKTILFEFSTVETLALKSLCLSVSTGAGATLYMAALALFDVLLAKLSGAEDIVVGTPTAGRSRPDLQSIIGMFVGTLAMRHFPAAEKNFNVFLEEIRERTLAAFEHQDYPFEELVEKVVITRDAGRSPLFDVMLAVQNIDRPGIEIPGLIVKPRSFDYSPANFDLFLQCYESGDILKWSLNYSISLFEETTIRRFIVYFKEIVKSVSLDPRQRIADIDMLPGEERKQLLYDFNCTVAEYPVEKTIHQLFEGQVEKSPDRIALSGEPVRPVSLTYRQLNEQSNRLAGLLVEKGVLADSIVGLMIERSIEMIIGIWGILKAGGAYLPIDPELPQERTDYMLKDSGAKIIVGNRHACSDKLNCQLSIVNCELLMGARSLQAPFHHSSFIIHHSNHLAYIIYTSGSTGRPKGVMIENRAVVNFITGLTAVIPFTSADSILALTTISFDIFLLEALLPLTAGSRVVIGTSEQQTDPAAFAAVMEREVISHLQVTPSRLRLFMDHSRSVRCLKQLRYLLVGGELFPDHLLQKVQTFIKGRIYNLYGPTETTVWSMIRSVEKGDRGINIGQPMANTQVFILSSHCGVQPIGVLGELCIGGAGVARGYLNNPELTGEKFIKSRFYRSYKTYIFYKTGDLARWLPDGSIEFFGRSDHQVKIRGFRIELGEIEALLLKHNDIEEAVVVVLPDRSGDRQLCAYIKTGRELSVQEPRDHLARQLPSYMIPGRFVFLERVPLTPSGKVDRKALPSPEPAAGTGEYCAPRDEVEENLLNIWSEILETDKERIGIDGNFFQLGGHSLRVINMTMRIHREFSVKIGMTEAFRNPTIRGLAGLIRGVVGNRLVTIPPAEEREYYDLTSAQKRLYVLYRLDPQSTVYNMTTRVILEGRLDRERLENSFRELIRRHESLRTSFQITAGNPAQRIHEKVEFEIEYDDLATEDTEDTEEKNHHLSFIIQHFSSPFDLANAPLLRVALVKMEECRHLLMVDMPHIIADGLAHRLLVEEFMVLYRGETLPPPRMQYRDFSQWQNSPAMQEEMRRQENFWLSRFDGDIPALQIPLDYPRTGVRSSEGSTMTFELAASEAQKLREMAAEAGATLFMVMLAVFNVLLYKLSGQEDIVVGTAVAGRNHPDLERVIGIFLNTLALRNFPRGQLTFKRFLTDVKEQTLAAFDHQDYQFEELVQKVMKIREKGRNPLFDVMFGFTPYTPVSAARKSSAGENPGELRFKPYKRKGLRSRFDITFTGADNGETFVFLFEYSTALFKPRTMERFAGYFKEIAASAAASPHVLLKDIAITTDLTPAVSDAFRDDENDFKF